MNRREFTASLAALAAAPLLPLQALAAGQAPTVVPTGAYAWAQLIARAQNTCSPDMLTRQLHVAPDAAQAMFNDMLRDGVLRTPGATGIARAVKPIDATGTSRCLSKRITSKLRDLAEERSLEEEERDDAHPLVKADDPRLGCDKTQTKDTDHASPNQHLQESPEQG